MTNEYAGLSPSEPEVNGPSGVQEQLDALRDEIHRLGLTRFVGRLNSGIIDPEIGSQALELHLAEYFESNIISRITHLLCNRADTYR